MKSKTLGRMALVIKIATVAGTALGAIKPSYAVPVLTATGILASLTERIQGAPKRR